MARITFEERAFSDPRADHVRKLLGWRKRDVFGTLALLWHDSQERLKPTMSLFELCVAMDLMPREKQRVVDAFLCAGYVRKIGEDEYQVAGCSRRMEQQKVAKTRARAAIESRWSPEKKNAKKNDSMSNASKRLPSDRDHFAIGRHSNGDAQLTSDRDHLNIEKNVTIENKKQNEKCEDTSSIKIFEQKHEKVYTIELENKRIRDKENSYKISNSNSFQKDKRLPSLRSGNDVRCSSESEQVIEVLKLEPTKVEPKRQRSKKGDDPIGANFVIADYTTLYREKFDGSDPVVAGANAGAAKTLVRMVGLDEARRIVKAYFEIPDAFYATKNYPLTLLVRDVSKVKTFADTGSTITMGRARQAEKQADNAAVINRVLTSNVGRRNGHAQQKRESMVDILASIDEPKNITPVAQSSQSNEEAPPW